MDLKPSNCSQERRRGLGPTATHLYVCPLYYAAYKHTQLYGKGYPTGTVKAKATGHTDVSAAQKTKSASPNSA